MCHDTSDPAGCLIFHHFVFLLSQHARLFPMIHHVHVQVVIGHLNARTVKGGLDLLQQVEIQRPIILRGTPDPHGIFHAAGLIG